MIRWFNLYICIKN